jgi:hypothetical protein
MQKLRVILAIAVLAGAIATTNAAEARHYRHVGVYNGVMSEGSCTPPPPPSWYIYPSADWGPFFRRPDYVYGPVLICAPATATSTVISVRY